MTKQVLIDLIKSHYEGDPYTFFDAALTVLKEFKENGDDALVSYLDCILKTHVEIAPKRELPKDNPMISFEDAVDLGWTLVPQEKEEEEPDYSICPNCGSHNIAWNKDIKNPWIKCKDCGCYLREGKHFYE